MMAITFWRKNLENFILLVLSMIVQCLLAVPYSHLDISNVAAHGQDNEVIQALYVNTNKILDLDLAEERFSSCSCRVTKSYLDQDAVNVDGQLKVLQVINGEFDVCHLVILRGKGEFFYGSHYSVIVLQKIGEISKIQTNNIVIVTFRIESLPGRSLHKVHINSVLASSGECYELDSTKKTKNIDGRRRRRRGESTKKWLDMCEKEREVVQYSLMNIFN